MTFRVQTELSGYEEFHTCCLGGASDGYLDNGDDGFSVMTGTAESKRDDNRVDRMLLENLSHLCLVGIVDGSSLYCGGNVFELGCVSGQEKDFGVLFYEGLGDR